MQMFLHIITRVSKEHVHIKEKLRRLSISETRLNVISYILRYIILQTNSTNLNIAEKNLLLT
jgi:hypothetical protein